MKKEIIHSLIRGERLDLVTYCWTESNRPLGGKGRSAE